MFSHSLLALVAPRFLHSTEPRKTSSCVSYDDNFTACAHNSARWCKKTHYLIEVEIAIEINFFLYFPCLFCSCAIACLLRVVFCVWFFMTFVFISVWRSFRGSLSLCHFRLIFHAYLFQREPSSMNLWIQWRVSAVTKPSHSWPSFAMKFCHLNPDQFPSI